MKRFAEFAISLALAVLILYDLLRHFDLHRTAESVRHAHPGLLTLGITLIVAAHFLRGWRWSCCSTQGSIYSRRSQAQSSTLAGTSSAGRSPTPGSC